MFADTPKNRTGIINYALKAAYINEKIRESRARFYIYGIRAEPYIYGADLAAPRQPRRGQATVAVAARFFFGR
jgi:hypothetical protein